MRHAFKEWASICQALAAGTQSIILRKGGIAEENGVFAPDHSAFWLYPTFVHQQADGIKPRAIPYLHTAEKVRPPPGVLRLTHYAKVGRVYRVRELSQALTLDDLHFWSEQTVRQRFEYREPGLWVLVVRVHRAPQPWDLSDLPEYEGCKTWLELGQDLPVEPETVPVLHVGSFAPLLNAVERLLKPSG